MNKRFKKFLSTTAGMGSALGISFGVVFGLASTQNTVRYLNLEESTPYQYFGGGPDGTGIIHTTKEVTSSLYTNNWGANPNKMQDFKMMLDGSTHQAMDQSFNQSAFLGLASWVQDETNPATNEDYDDLQVMLMDDLRPDMGIALKPISDSPSGFISSYISAINSGAKALVLPGYLHASPLQQFAQDNQTKAKFNSAGYIFLDYDAGSFGEEAAKHIASVVFRTEQSAFLTAIAACHYLNNNFDEYWSPDKPLAIGTYGGNPIPTVTCYMGGLELGTYLYNQMITDHFANFGYQDTDPDLPDYYKNHLVNFINLGKPSSWFTYSFNIGDGKLLTQTLLSMGADVIMPVAGPQTIDTVQEIKNQGSKCIVIGVDTPQEYSTTVNDNSVYTDKELNANNAGFSLDFLYHHPNNKIIKFSAIKQMARMVDIIGWLARNGFTATNTEGIGSYGYLTAGDLVNGGTGASDAAAPYLMDFFDKLMPGEVNYAASMSDIIWYITNQSAAPTSTELPLVRGLIDHTPIKWTQLIDWNLCFRT